MCTMKLRSLIGTKSFYRTVLAIAVPVMIQSGITQFVGLLDNLMVGRLGTEQMSGVAIANQLIFIFNLCIFGGLSGAGIFGAQFAGKKDVEGIRNVFRFKLIVCILICAICLIAFGFWNTPLISLFLHEGSAEGDLALTLRYGQEYMRIMLLGLVPYALSQAYASTLRETGETVRPMAASIAAVLTNLVLNYLLIFGKLGLPAMGAAGAATATVVSRFVELGLIMYWSHAHPERTPFFIDAYRSLRVPRALALHIVQKGAPLLLNEALWSVGMSFLNQCYSTRGLAVIAAVNISSTVSQLFNIVFASLGSSIGIVVGNLLGAGKREEARVTDWQMIAFSVATCFVLGGLLAATSGLMGMVSGSAVANVATTGVMTIPMMKKIGYEPEEAGAIEAVASTGGQFTPPIMGAVGFVMAEFMVVSYTKVMLAAADTFRAAAGEQLSIWGDRVGVNVVRHGEGADPSAVIYDAIQSAKAKGMDVLICDTAGRLQNKKNLMDELNKMNKVISREWPEAARENLLVLDATTGKNAVSQVEEFGEVASITGIVLTKLDGTAKGGIVITIADEFDMPVKFVGLGEGIDDLKEFDPMDFANGIFAE